jgi:hypothetical protein
MGYVSVFQIALQTSFGQMLDLISSHESERDISKYNMPVYVNYARHFERNPHQFS